MKPLTTIILKGALLGAGAVFGAGMVVAWTGPSGTAPNSNVSAPINVSGTAQVKSGTLQASRFYDDNAAYYVDSNVTSVMNAIDAAGTITAPRFYTDSATYLPHTNGYNYLRGHTYFNGVLYDENDTGYYLNPSATSRINYGVWDNLYVYGDITLGGITVNDAFYIDGLPTGDGTHYVCWGNGGNKVKKKGSGCAVSDRRLKEHIVPLTVGLDEILKLNPVSFEWKDKKLFEEGTKIGLIAQEVKEVFPEVVTGTGVGDDWYGLDYDALVAPMIKAIQELKADNDELRAELKELRQLVESR
ncbi:MAG: tail fiber domain-containing protein [Candidatus Pacebacteria bacterium]|nr:tail fiber domain-containing protein [Candidatus Paceibacterota bacterium]